MKKAEVISTTLIYDDSSSIEYYEKILKKTNIILNNSIEISKLNTIDDKNIDLLVIDLNSKFNVKKINSINLNNKIKVILVVPLNEKYLDIKQNIKKNIYHTFSKPLNFETFYKVLNSVKLQVNRTKYILNKENLLINQVDKSPFKMAIYNLDGDLTYANAKYTDLKNLGFLAQEVNFNEIKVSNLDFKEVIHNLKTKFYFITEENIDSKWYKSYFYYIKEKEFISHTLMDITKEKLTLDSLKKTALFFNQTSEGVLITDKNGSIITTNEAFSKITGYTKDEIIGKPTSILASGIHEKGFYQNLWDNLVHHGRWQGEIWNRRKNGEVYPEWLSITQIKDEVSHEVNYMALFTDISSVKEADKKIHFYAKHDHLTGLLNRVQFENMLNHTIDRAFRNNKRFALMYIDLDRFKEINDTYGHNVGDLMLKSISSRLQNILRKEDIIARIGGDEFNVIIDNINDEVDALNLATKLNDNIRKEVVIDGITFYPSFSIGIAVYPEHGRDSRDLIMNADSAMYEVKKNGRDGVMIYDTHFTKSLMQKVELQNKLKSAIKDEILEVYYQPVIDLSNNSIIGAEALIRWHDKDLGYISPEVFIPIAEDHGMIYDIGQFVMKRSFEDLLKIFSQGKKDFKLSINVSTREFFKDDYIENVKSIINDFSIDPDNIELEITETNVMKNHESAIEKMKALKELGFSIAIDDFGTGYSSLNYLKTFPIDKLKIDKSFILDILENKDDKLIVETIITMAKIFGFDVQAEGIESKEHEQLLKELNCDKAQGYYYDKPMCFDEFLAQLRR